MATSRFVLKMIPGVDPPAIISLISAENKLGWVRMLDLGANVDCTAEALLQFLPLWVRCYLNQVQWYY